MLLLLVAVMDAVVVVYTVQLTLALSKSFNMEKWIYSKL
jgi:hypothetical protein